MGTVGWDWTAGQGQDVDDALTGKTLFVTGCIFYRGLDGNPYFSDICVSWAGESNFPSCADVTRNFVH